MYGLPGSPIQFGAKRARSKPGRKSAKAVFLEKQRDLFPVDLYTSKLSAARPPTKTIGGRPERSEDGPRSKGGDLYVLVTRKGSLKNETKHPGRAEIGEDIDA